jgi:hypothetical protein
MTEFLLATMSIAKQRWWFYMLVQGFIVHVSVKNTLKVWQYLRSKDISQGSKDCSPYKKSSQESSAAFRIFTV